MSLKKSDIFYFNVEFSDKKGLKQRPVVVISKHKDELNFLEISSRSYLENDAFTVKLINDNYSLPKDSYVKIWKIGTINESALPNDLLVLDKVKPDDLSKIIEKLNEYFSQDW